MNITLYQDCMITPAYREVFDTVRRYGNQNKTAFDYYLKTLNYKRFEIQNRYLDDSGILKLPIGYQETAYENNHELLNFSPYMYNYMEAYITIDEINPITGQNNGRTCFVQRYYFIENITLSNNIAIIKYSVDYWHTYRSSLGGVKEAVYAGKISESDYSNIQHKFKTRYGYLTSSKIVDYSPTNFKLQFYKPPMEYTGNNGINFKSLALDSEPRGCYLIVTMSRYKTSNSGEYSQRRVDTFIVYLAESYNADSKEFSLIHYSHSLNHNDTDYSDYVSILNELLLKSSDPNGVFGKNDDGFKYYEIISAYALPTTMASAGANRPLEYSDTYRYYTDYIPYNGVYLILQNFEAIMDMNMALIGTAFDIRKWYITNDFKNYAVGLFSYVVPLNPNGNDVEISLKITSTTYQIGIYLNVQNTLYDITDQLEIKLPIQVSDASTMALAQLNRQLEKTILENQKIQAGIDLARSEVKSVSGIVSGVSQSILTGGVSGIGSMITGIAETGLSIGDFEVKKDNINAKLNANSAKVYTSNKGMQVGGNGGVNAYYGLILLSINADNDVEVENAIKAFGYDCSEIVNVDQILNLADTVAEREKYNVVKFIDVTVYGSFPQNVGMILESILKNGVKIWYTHEIQ